MKETSDDGNVYFSFHNQQRLILILYVDDLYLIENDISYHDSLNSTF